MLVSNLFDKKGESLSTRSHYGYVNYRTRITIEKHVENDPTFQCRNYLENVDYSKCLQERYIGEVFLLLGCIPPWLGGKEEIWCNSTLQNINGKIQHLEDILTNRYTDTECKYLIGLFLKRNCIK